MTRPQAVGRYQIQRILGQGAMGTVYLAQDPLLMRLVAVKALRDPGSERAQIMARFHREAVISAKLNHPHVITIFDVGEDPEHGPFMAMEYIDGVSLASLIREGLPPEQGLRLLVQTMSALVAAEASGIAHRDVKPENILVSKDWRVKLMDFGIARSESARITMGGRIFGTPHYTPPEVLSGAEATPVSDRYAFVVTAFQVLSGTLPFQGANIGAVIYAIVHDPPAFPDSMDSSLRIIFERALAKDPASRYPDLLVFMEALIETVALPPASRTRLRHYVSEIRDHATEPPMGLTQSLEGNEDIENLGEALDAPPPPSPESLELDLLDDDVFSKPSYETVAVPMVNILTFAAAKRENARPKAAPVPTPAPVPAPPPLAAPALASPPAPPAAPQASLSAAPPPGPTPKGMAPKAMVPEAPSPEAPAPEARPTAPPLSDTRPMPVLTLPEAEAPPIQNPGTPRKPKHVDTQPLPALAAPILPDPIPDPGPQRVAVHTGSASTRPIASKKPGAASSRRNRTPIYLGAAGGLVLAGILGALLWTRGEPGSQAPAVAASIAFTSTPSGAAVYLDDQRVGTTPLERTLELATAHVVRLELPGYQAVTRELRPGQKAVHIALQASGFAIAVNTDPPGADVFVNDQFAGTTPMPTLPVPREGRCEISLRLPGYAEWKADLDPDLPFPDPILLSPLPGRKRKR